MADTVAVVEDEPYIAELLEFLVGSTGREVRVFPTGAQARAYFQEQKFVESGSPKMVVLDLMMPNDDGEQLYDDYLKPGSGWLGGRPKVLVLSAVGQPQVKDRLLAAGADGFMTKPFANEAFLAEVERLCG